MGRLHTLVRPKSAGVFVLIGCCRLLVQLAGMLGCFDGGHWNSDRQTNLDWWCSLSRVTANIITRPLAAAPTARLCPLQWPVATFVSETDEQHDRRKDRYLRDQDHFSRPLCMATWAQRWGARERTRGSTADYAISACEVVDMISSCYTSISGLADRSGPFIARLKLSEHICKQIYTVSMNNHHRASNTIKTKLQMFFMEDILSW